MKKRALQRALIFLSVFFILHTGPFLFAEEVPIRIDGQVVRSDEAKRLLTVRFEHPATGEKSQKEFLVRNGAGFKDFKRLGDLKENDLVSLDYLDYQPVPQAIYIIKMPVTKTYFTKKEIAEALLNINTNRKHSNAKQS